MNFRFLGQLFLTVGVVFLLLGGVSFLAGKLPGVGRLPGDIVIRWKNSVFYFPLATSILLSLILTLFLNFFFRR